MGDDRPNVYEEDGIWVYRASSLGNCVRGLVAARMGIEPMPHPDWLLEKFDQGNIGEPVILDWLRDQGWMIEETHGDESGQLEVELAVGKGAKVRCHPDGIGYKDLDVANRHVIEVKTVGVSYWEDLLKKGLEAFPYYAMQVSIEMACTGLPCLFVMGLKDDKGVVYKFHKEVITTPPISVGQIKAKVLKVEMLAGKGELDAVKCDYNQYPCQYYHLHDEENEVVEVDEDLEVDLLLSSYVRGQELEKQGKELKGPAGEQLKKILEQRGVEKMERLKHVISTVSRSNVTTDWAGVAEEVGAEVVKKHTKTTVSKFVKVTEKREKEKDA